MAMAAASTSTVIASSTVASSTAPRTFPAGLSPTTLLQPKKPTLASKAVSNGSRITSSIEVLNPYNNLKYETLSYLPQLTTEQVLKQVDYMIRKQLIPCIEFSTEGSVYRRHFHGSGYYDGRYWTMWKLPMFGCQDSTYVLREIEECKKAYPSDFVRVIGFDRVRQVQILGFVVHKPPADVIAASSILSSAPPRPALPPVS